MKTNEFWGTKKCLGKDFISEFMYEFMENHEFLKYTNSWKIHMIWAEFVYEFTYET